MNNFINHELPWIFCIRHFYINFFKQLLSPSVWQLFALIIHKTTHLLKIQIPFNILAPVENPHNFCTAVVFGIYWRWITPSVVVSTGSRWPCMRADHLSGHSYLWGIKRWDKCWIYQQHWAQSPVIRQTFTWIKSTHFPQKQRNHLAP